MTEMRMLEVRYPFDGLEKGHTFPYDETIDKDGRVDGLIEGGFLAYVGDPAPTQRMEPVGIESQEKAGVIGGDEDENTEA